MSSCSTCSPERVWRNGAVMEPPLQATEPKTEIPETQLTPSASLAALLSERLLACVQSFDARSNSFPSMYVSVATLTLPAPATPFRRWSCLLPSNTISSTCRLARYSTGPSMGLLVVHLRRRARLRLTALEPPRTRKAQGSGPEGRGVEQSAHVDALVALQQSGLRIQRIIEEN